MPLYEYECKKCGQTFEVMQKFSDEPLTKHPKCGGKVSKLISAAGLQFKGTGWYITDYARAGGAAPEKAESGKSEEGAKAKPDTETKKAEPAAAAKPASETSSKSAAKAKKKK